MKKLFNFFALLILITKGYSQNIDSLQHLLSKADNNEKIELLIIISQTVLVDSFNLAYNYGKEAIKISNKTKDNKLKGQAQYNLGLIFMQAKNYDSAFYCLKESEKLFKDNYNIDKQLLTTIKLADCYDFINESEKAIQYYEKAIDMAKELNQTNTLSELYSKLSVLHYLKSDYAKSIEFLDEKLEVVIELNDSSKIAETFNNISANKRRLGNYNEAIEYSQKSIDIFNLLHDTIGVAEAFLNMGSIYYYSDNYPQAIKYFIQASEVFEQKGVIRSAAGIYNNIGSVYNETKDYKKALLYYTKALEMYEKMNSKHGIAVVTGNLGLVYEGLGNFDKAREFFTKSLTYQKQLGNKEGIAQLISNIAGLYLVEGNTKEAKLHFDEALNLADEGNFLPLKLSIYENLIKLEEKSGNYKKTVEMMCLHQILKDSLQNQESREQLNEMQSKLELHEHKAKIEILSKENDIQIAKVEKQKLFITAIIIVSILFLILIIIILYALSYSKKAKALLQQQNDEISQQRNEIAIKNKQFTDSIKYASRTQKAMLSPFHDLKNVLKDFFIVSKPQSIVSGDFYWFRNSADRLYIALADCTGHGVPGAFMSILGHTFLNEIVDKNPNLPANILLDELRNKIKNSLHQKNYDGNMDGMDISLCIFNKNSTKHEFAGAYNPLYIMRNGELIALEADKMPVSIARNEKPFTLQYFELETGDKFYLSTDGFYDQFGGTNYTKITSKTFKQLLIKNQNLPLQEQGAVIESYFEDWKANNEQTDDISIIGFEI